MSESLPQVLGAIEARRDELVALTRKPVRIRAANPPGDAYRECAEAIGRRLRRRGFAVEYVRGHGAPGDHDRYPRINASVSVRPRLTCNNETKVKEKHREGIEKV